MKELVHAFSSTSFPGCSLYLEVERGPWERGWLLAVRISVNWMHLGSLKSTQEATVALGYSLEQLSRFFPIRALQTSRMYP